MSQNVIIYASVHHHNTEKVVKYIAPEIQADVINILKTPEPDISRYDHIIFASGIYFNQIHKSQLSYIEGTAFEGRKTAVLYTCGMHYKEFAKPVEKLLKSRGADYIGSCYCRGYDTFGLLKKIGGIAKKHPNQIDFDKMLEAARKFCGGVK